MSIGIEIAHKVPRANELAPNEDNKYGNDTKEMQLIATTGLLSFTFFSSKDS